MLISIQVHYSFVLLLFGVATASGASGQEALLRDTDFKEGFGAAWSYGKAFSTEARREGVLLAYRDISPLQVKLIPEGAVARFGALAHPWDFEEGLHGGFTNGNGRVVGELHEHRLVVNHVIETNTPTKLQFAQFNNAGLGPDDPQRDRRLVKRITSDRQGTLRLVYNSQNELRNAAINHTPAWARDTWPHLLVVQRFESLPKLRDYSNLVFRVTFQVERLNRLSEWPSGLPGAGRPSMNLKYMVFLRRLDDPSQALFAGTMLFTSLPSNYQEHIALEQWGTVFYRDSIARMQSIPALGEKRSLDVNVKTLVERALAKAKALDKRLSSDPDEYYLSSFSIGWEGLGHWETESVLSGLSLAGCPVSGASCSLHAK